MATLFVRVNGITIYAEENLVTDTISDVTSDSDGSKYLEEEPYYETSEIAGESDNEPENSEYLKKATTKKRGQWVKYKTRYYITAFDCDKYLCFGKNANEVTLTTESKTKIEPELFTEQ